MAQKLCKRKMKTFFFCAILFIIVQKNVSRHLQSLTIKKIIVNKIILWWQVFLDAGVQTAVISNADLHVVT